MKGENRRVGLEGVLVEQDGKMARSVLPVYAMNWSVMRGTWSLASCRMTA